MDNTHAEFLKDNNILMKNLVSMMDSIWKIDIKLVKAFLLFARGCENLPEEERVFDFSQAVEFMKKHNHILDIAEFSQYFVIDKLKRITEPFHVVKELEFIDGFYLVRCDIFPEFDGDELVAVYFAFLPRKGTDENIQKLTEEVKAYKTLAASNFNAGRVGLWRLSYEDSTPHLYLSKECLGILGLENDDDHRKLHKAFMDCLDPTGRVDLFSMKAKMIEGGTHYMVCPYYHSTKGLIIIKISGEADKYLSNKDAEFSGYCQDVTNVDDSLAKIKSEFDGMYKAISKAGVTSCIYRPKQKKMFFSEQAVRMYDLKVEYNNMPKSFVADYVHETNQLAVINSLKYLEMGVPTAEIRFSNRDRSVTLKLSLSVVLRDENDQPEEIFGVLENITQLEKTQNEAMSIRRAHETLMEQAEEISELNKVQRQMTESFPLGILAYTLPERKILICNNEAFRLMNHPVDETLSFSGDELMQYVYQEDRPKIAVEVRKLKHVGDTVDYSYRTTLANGSMAYIKCTSRITVLDNGTKYVLSGLRDMTDLMLTNQLLYSERASFRDVLVNNALFTFVSDITDDMMVEVIPSNHECDKIINIGDELPMEHDVAVKAFVKNNRGQYLSRNDREYFRRDHLLTAFYAGVTAEHVEMYLSNADIYVRMTILMSENPINGHVFCYSFCNDISDQKKSDMERIKMAEEKALLQSTLLEEERRAHRQDEVLSVLSSEFYFIGYVDLFKNKFSAIRASENVSRLLGISLNTEMSYSDTYKVFVDNVVVPEDREDMSMYLSTDYLMECASRDGIHNKIFKMKANGEEVYCQMRFARPDDVDFSCIIIGFSDVDKATREKISNQEELKVALAKAELANVAKTSFLNSMSHDIRTPMNAIIGFTTLALSHVDEKEKLQEYLSKIQSSSGHLLALINDVLDMSRIESGKIHIEEKENTISSIFENIRNIVTDDATAKSLQVTFDYSKIEHDRVWCDKLRLSQVLLNCLSNAIKFTPSGGAVSMTVTEMPGDKYAIGRYEFRIKDSGIGMSKEFVTKIFEPFERARTSTVSGIQGTGLGMSICKSIVDMMNGDIRVESEEGKGSEFIINLKLSVVMDIEPLRKGKKAETSSTERRLTSVEGLKILLVEDNFMNSEIAYQILTESKAIVEKAFDGKEAVDIIESSDKDRFDLILMDIQMPVMDGYEATKAIRSMADDTKANIPIVAMTANAFDEDRKAAFDAGMNAHIAKPIDVGLMLKTILDVLEKGNIL